MKAGRFLAVLLLTLFFCTGQVSAEEGRVTAMQKHQAWISALITVHSGISARMMTSALNDMEVSLALDCTLDYRFSLSIIVGKREDRGRFFLRQGPSEQPVQLRVDRNNIYHAMALVSEDDACIYINIDVGMLDRDFVEQMRNGRYLRIMVFNAKDAIPRFSLQGFTAAFNRSMALLRQVNKSQNDDQRFFKAPHDDRPVPRPPRQQDDSMYF